MTYRLVAVLVAAVALAGCTKDSTTAVDSPSENSPVTGVTCNYPTDGRDPAKQVTPPSDTARDTGEVSVTIGTSRGDITAVLTREATPCTVHSFLSLAEQGYFDDTRCHRLTTADSGISVLQCGDPTGTGSGGPGYSFADELSGQETYPAGTLAMANAGPDTNGSQFFLVYGDTPLPPSYSVFGSIDAAGLSVIEKIAEAGSDNAYGPGSGHPNTEVTIRSVTTR